MRRAVLLTVAVVFLVLALGGVALAASPQDIYNDYTADQKLDGTYTDAELQAFLDNALTIQYADPTIVAGLTTTVTAMLNADEGTATTTVTTDATGTDQTADQDEARGTFPFTGSQLSLIALFAMVLIGAGVGLRRLAGSRR